MNGSAVTAEANRGAGILTSFPEGQTATLTSPQAGTAPPSRHRQKSSCWLPSRVVAQASDGPCKQAVFLSDALSALQTQENNNLPKLSCSKYVPHKGVPHWWIPAPCGISGNERADELGKRGAHGTQPDNSAS